MHPLAVGVDCAAETSLNARGLQLEWVVLLNLELPGQADGVLTCVSMVV